MSCIYAGKKLNDARPVAQYILKGGKEVKSKNRFVIYGIILFASLLLSPLSPRLNVVSIVATATSGSAQDIQSAINQVAGQGGGEVYIPAGTHDFATGSWQWVTIPDGVSVFGAPTQRDADGQVISWETVLRMPFEAPETGEQSTFFRVQDTIGTRISDIKFVGYREIDPASTKEYTAIKFTRCDDFRVDHCYFRNICGQTVVSWYGSGVVDHNKFINYPAHVEELYVPCTVTYAVAISGDGVWEPDITNIFGHYTSQTVFIEDNYFETWRHAVSSNGGAHYVFRHNTERNNGYGSIDGHAGTRAIEAYNNDFAQPNTPDHGYGFAIQHKGGGGAFFDNSFDGYGLLSAPEAYSACIVMVQGVSDSTPEQQVKDVYIWNNTVTPVDADYWDTTQGNKVNQILEDRDFFLRAPTQALDGFTYTPYTYPHPLVSGDPPSPPPPPPSSEGYWSLNITSTPSAGGTTSPTGLQNILVDNSIAVTAVPNQNYSLAYWIFDGTNYGVVATVTIPAQAENSTYSLEAVFWDSANEPFPPSPPDDENEGTSPISQWYAPLSAIGFIAVIEGVHKWRKRKD